jgi:hypothetical protein
MHRMAGRETVVELPFAAGVAVRGAGFVGADRSACWQCAVARLVDRC